jgi:transcriptional regulator with XRE-family HTH domain
MTAAEAAIAAGMSKARWSQIENGYETRGDGFKEVRGRRDTIAHMANAVGVSPERLEEAGRPDAARVLREIQRNAPAEPAAVPGPQPEPPPELEFEDDDPLTPEERAAALAFIREVRKGIARVRAREEAERQGNGHTASA